MTRLLYFTAVEIVDGKLDGVAKKVLSQCRAFEKRFGEGNVYYTAFVEDGYASQRLSTTEAREYFNLGSAKQRRLKLKAIYPQLLRFVIENGIDSVYFRSPGLDIYTHRLFKEFRKNGVSTILEIPTWPFWSEKKREIKEAFACGFAKGALKAVGAIGYWTESRRLVGLVDSIVTFADVEQIWGLPAFGLSNGYDFDSVPTLKTSAYGKELKFVVAATLRRNHGIDRMIKAVARYRGTIPISFHIAGEGDASAELRELAKELDVLDRSVFFHGYVYGQELVDLYEECDVGVSALGFHRYGVFDCSPLKTKEYLAFGLPCLGTDSEKDIMRTSASRFFYAVSSDEEPIALDAAVEYFCRLKQEGFTREDVRQAGKESFDWTSVMMPVAERFCELAIEKG